MFGFGSSTFRPAQLQRGTYDDEGVLPFTEVSLSRKRSLMREMAEKEAEAVFAEIQGKIHQSSGM